MKKSKLLAFIGTITMAAAGVVAFASVRENKPVEVSATTERTIYCKMDQGWWTKDGAAVGAHTWGSPGPGTSWPGTRMSLVSGETNIWSIKVDLDKVQNIIFTRVNASGSISDWGAKSKDQKLPSKDSTQNIFIFDSNEVWGDPGCEGHWDTYYPGAESGFRVVGKFGNCNWGVDNSVLMSEEKESGYNYSVKADVDLKLHDVFCVVYFNKIGGFDWGQSFRFDSLQNEGFKYCFGNAGDGDSNIECWAGGTYTIRCHNFSGQNKTIYVSSSDGKVNAEQLAAKLMSFGDLKDNDNKCGDSDRFPLVKSMYLGMSSKEQGKFQNFSSSLEPQFVNGYQRYVAWGNALNENLWSEGKISGLNTLITATADNNPTMIITIVALIGVASIGGYFFYRKRKEI